MKGYLSNYGQRVGLNYGDLLSLYYKQAKRRDVQRNRAARSSCATSGRSRSGSGCDRLLTVAVGLAAWWWRRRFGAAMVTQRTSAPAEAEPAAAAAARAAGPAAERRRALEDGQPPVDAAIAGRGPVEAPAGRRRRRRRRRRCATPGRGAAGRDPARSPSSRRAGSKSRIRMAASSVRFGRRRPAGRGARRAAVPVVLGNAEAVRLNVDGETIPIPTTGRQGDLVRFT